MLQEQLDFRIVFGWALSHLAALQQQQSDDQDMPGVDYLLLPTITLLHSLSFDATLHYTTCK